MREDGRQDGACAKHDDTHEQALACFLRPDIDELCLAGGHRKLPVGIIDFFALRFTLVIVEIRMFRIELSEADRDTCYSLLPPDVQQQHINNGRSGLLSPVAPSGQAFT